MKPKRFFALLLLCALLGQEGLAQTEKEKIFSAVVVDSIERTPVEGCTVTVLSSQPRKIATSAKGLFSLQQNADTILLLFQHTGYAEKRLFLLPQKASRSDTVFLSPIDKLMEGIVVKAKVPPIVVRGDTTEYNIDSTMFEPFDAVEDLVRRLPGLTIDANGQMSFHGKPITRILVDGEDLFGGEGDFAMKKIPAGMVAKIQVMDTKTLEQLFSGVASTGDDKTLNIRLKEGNKTFGSVDAGAGTLNQLESSANLSRFTSGMRINLTAGYNSNNKAGLLRKIDGPYSSLANAGINYGNSFGRLRLNGSYAYNENTNGNNYYRERTQIITADTSFFTRTSSRYDGRGYSHRANLTANLWIDSSSILDATLSYSTAQSNNTSRASSSTAENGTLRNESLNLSSSNNETQNVAATVYWRKWFNRKGRSISVNARLNAAQQQSNVLSQSTNTYFKTGLPASGDTLDRQTLTTGTTKNYNVSLTYLEPLSKTLRLSLNGSFDVNQSESNRRVYNLDSLSHSAQFDSLYSAIVVSSVQTQNMSASLVYNGKNLNINTGLATVWQQTERLLQKQLLKQDLVRYSPTLNAAYNMGKNKFLRMAFSATTIQPTPDQVQPVPDNTNPLYIRIGNPKLRTSFAQNYSLNYNQNNAATTFALNAAYAPVSNQIVNAVTYDAFRRATSQYINVNGVYTARANLNFSKLFRNGERSTTWSASSGLTTGRQVYFQLNNRYDSRNFIINGNLGFSKRRQAVRSPSWGVSVSASQSRNYTPQDLKVLNTTRYLLAPQLQGTCTVAGFIFASASYNFSYNKLAYHSTQRRDDEYLLHGANSSLRFQVLKKWYIQSTLWYQYNTQAPEGAARGQFNSNLSANAQLWKNRGRASLTISDLFATSRSLQRIVTDNYIEDLQTPVLRNVVTLKLQYAFSKLEKKEKQPTSNIK